MASKVLILLFGVLCLSCSDVSSGGTYYFIEIAPGKFVPVKFPRFIPEDMVIKYEGKIVHFKIPIGPNKPESLMEYDGRLYVLAFDASGKRMMDWRWRCFEQEGERFKEIPSGSFPKSIAILNIWRPGDPRRFNYGAGGEKLDMLVMSRECDTENKYFPNTCAARLWYMLAVTNDWEKACGKYKSSDPTFVREYKAKHKPVHLTSMELKPVPKEQQNF